MQSLERAGEAIEANAASLERTNEQLRAAAGAAGGRSFFTAAVFSFVSSVANILAIAGVFLAVYLTMKVFPKPPPRSLDSQWGAIGETGMGAPAPERPPLSQGVHNAATGPAGGQEAAVLPPRNSEGGREANAAFTLAEMKEMVAAAASAASDSSAACLSQNSGKNLSGQQLPPLPEPVNVASTRSVAAPLSSDPSDSGVATAAAQLSQQQQEQGHAEMAVGATGDLQQLAGMAPAALNQR